MLSKDQETILMLIAGTTMLMLLGVFIIGFLLVYQKKQNKNAMEKEQLKSSFKQEILKTQIEIQEQTLNDVSREIHDNITQVLSFVKLSLSLMANGVDDENRAKINDNRELVAQTIHDLRHLSKSMSFEHISSHGLIKTIEAEVQRINKSGILNIDIIINGNTYSLGEQRELVIFRIFQEALNNTLKHAAAANLKISLYYHDQMFNLIIEDDGVGFVAQKADNNNNGGAGLRNMENRAALVGANVTINSEPANGCQISLSLNPLEETYVNGTNSNSLSRRPQTL